jgi:hypothetical protein
MDYSKKSNLKNYNNIIKKYIKYNALGDVKKALNDVEARNILYEELKDKFKSYKNRLFYLENYIYGLKMLL